ncbi:unnamed protein product [Euphydryas editha]|uniref:Uncharacterized protein n=1 Tax=Euphydryas editha TaxID=104508 RepID=A0AAU9TFH5_EUPED|nr:unnamed protein product [Euphydryas editha]
MKIINDILRKEYLTHLSEHPEVCLLGGGVASGDVLLIISLDLANAFNSFPVKTIVEAPKSHEVPHFFKGCRRHTSGKERSSERRATVGFIDIASALAFHRAPSWKRHCGTSTLTGCCGHLYRPD